MEEKNTSNAANIVSIIVILVILIGLIILVATTLNKRKAEDDYIKQLVTPTTQAQTESTTVAEVETVESNTVEELIDLLVNDINAILIRNDYSRYIPKSGIQLKSIAGIRNAIGTTALVHTTYILQIMTYQLRCLKVNI